jgi:hypothetical protein
VSGPRGSLAGDGHMHFLPKRQNAKVKNSGEAKMQELEITWERVMRVWWLIAWRGLLGGWILAVALAFLIGEAGGRLGFDFPTVAAIATALSCLAGLTWGLFVVKMALKKKYEKFRLALVAKS